MADIKYDNASGALWQAIAAMAELARQYAGEGATNKRLLALARAAWHLHQADKYLRRAY